MTHEQEKLHILICIERVKSEYPDAEALDRLMTLYACLANLVWKEVNRRKEIT